jgi:hypothetical protein
MAKGIIGWVLRIGAIAGLGYLIAGLLRRPRGSRTAGLRGNPKNRVFHAPSCRYYMAPGNTEEFETVQGALDAGFKPCKICSP